MALAEMEIGLMVNPSSELIRAATAQIYLAMGRPVEAEREAQTAVALAPGDALCRQMLGLAVEQRGNCHEAIDHFRRCVKSLTDDLRCRPALAHAEAICGQTVQARKTAQELDSHDNLSAALVHVSLGENARALDLLEKSYDRREPDLPFVKFDPRFGPVRADTRFQALLARLRLSTAPH
jgi:predicted Zn-dependent protease